MAIKQFARIIGVVLILVGIVGLVLGNKLWLGILNVDIVEDIVHLVTGGLLAYVGFGRTWRPRATWCWRSEWSTWRSASSGSWCP